MSSEETTKFEFRLPDPGEGLKEAELVEWHVDEGEQISEDEPLCDVETDKAVVDIPSPCTGTIEELVATEGDIIEVGEVIAVIETDAPPRQVTLEQQGDDENEVSEEPVEADDTQVAPSQITEEGDGRQSTTVAQSSQGNEKVHEGTSSDSGSRVFAAPSTRRFAREHDVDLEEVAGTGPGDRVTRSDVEAYIDGQLEAVGTPSESAESVEEKRVVRRPLRGLRRKIAENMVHSKTVIPHVTQGFEADASELVALKERLNAKHDLKITYTPILLKAVVPALKEFPEFNASVDEDAEEIIEKHYYNIGVATETEEGLIVPVIKNVDSKSILEVAEELQRVVEQSRDRSLDLDEMQGGTFTVTNMGGKGGSHGTFGTPIINHPETAILGVGSIENKPVAVSDDEVQVQKRIRLTLSFDHRVIDGVAANEFAEMVIENITDPDRFLSRL